MRDAQLLRSCVHQQRHDAGHVCTSSSPTSRGESPARAPTSNVRQCRRTSSHRRESRTACAKKHDALGCASTSLETLGNNQNHMVQILKLDAGAASGREEVISDSLPECLVLAEPAPLPLDVPLLLQRVELLESVRVHPCAQEVFPLRSSETRRCVVRQLYGLAILIGNLLRPAIIRPCRDSIHHCSLE